MMPPGYVPMPPPGMQGQSALMVPQDPYSQLPPSYNQLPPSYNQLPPSYTQAPNRQQPVVRGSQPEEKVPVRQEPPLSLPAPEKLGITGQTPAAPTAPSGVDWNAVHAYMKSIGVQEFGLERVPEGGYRFSVVMPTAEAGRSCRIDGAGSTETEAVRVCLDKTYRWLAQVP
jgi:hypothetical protein